MVEKERARRAVERSIDALIQLYALGSLSETLVEQLLTSIISCACTSSISAPALPSHRDVING